MDVKTILKNCQNKNTKQATDHQWLALDYSMSGETICPCCLGKHQNEVVFFLSSIGSQEGNVLFPVRERS